MNRSKTPHTITPRERFVQEARGLKRFIDQAQKSDLPDSLWTQLTLYVQQARESMFFATFRHCDDEDQKTIARMTEKLAKKAA